jgi:hypothetical protein
MKTMPVVPGRLSAPARSDAVGVDRENNVLRGYNVAQVGDFKSAGRGRFDDESLAAIHRLMRQNPTGLKSRFTHPTMSDDGLGSFLGRARNPRVVGGSVKADLHFDASAFDTPRGNLAKYVMDLAASDPDAISSSLVLRADQVETIDERGRAALDADGEPIPPVWRPTKLLASDIVDTGDAVDGLLSAGIDPDGLPLGALWKGCEMLDRVFAGQPDDVVESRLRGFASKYLAHRRGGASREDEIRRKLEAMS